jgi:hypothetical protein
MMLDVHGDGSIRNSAAQTLRLTHSCPAYGTEWDKGKHLLYDILCRKSRNRIPDPDSILISCDAPMYSPSHLIREYIIFTTLNPYLMMYFSQRTCPIGILLLVLLYRLVNLQFSSA